MSLLLCRRSRMKTQCDRDKQRDPALLDNYRRRWGEKKKTLANLHNNISQSALSGRVIVHQTGNKSICVLSELNSSACSRPLMFQKATTSGSINLRLPNGPFYFGPGTPDHLVGSQNHEGSHLVHGGLLVGQPGNGPCVGKASTILASDSMDFYGFTATEKRASVYAMAVLVCVCVVGGGGTRWPSGLWRPPRLSSGNVRPPVGASVSALTSPRQRHFVAGCSLKCCESCH